MTDKTICLQFKSEIRNNIPYRIGTDIKMNDIIYRIQTDINFTDLNESEKMNLVNQSILLSNYMGIHNKTRLNDIIKYCTLKELKQ